MRSPTHDLDLRRHYCALIVLFHSCLGFGRFLASCFSGEFDSVYCVIEIEKAKSWCDVLPTTSICDDIIAHEKRVLSHV